MTSRNFSMPRERWGMINRQLLAILASLILLGVLMYSLVDRGAESPAASQQSDSPAPQPLIVYVAASNKSVIEAIKADYEKAYKTPLQIRYGSSQTLLAAIQVAGSCDLFLPADSSYLDMAR